MATLPDKERARILAAAVDAYAREGPRVLERICAEHPDLAEEIRSAARVLEELRAGSAVQADETPRGLAPSR